MPPFFRSLQKSFWHTFAPVRAHARIRVVQAGVRVTRRDGKSATQGAGGRGRGRNGRTGKGEKDRERVDLLPTRLPACLPACPPASESHRRCPGASDFHAALRDNRGPFFYPRSLRGNFGMVRRHVSCRRWSDNYPQPRSDDRGRDRDHP